MYSQGKDLTHPMITPSLPPSIVIALLFGTATTIHFYRTIKLRRTVYSYLLAFSFLRTILFILRAIWSKHPSSHVLVVICGILLSGAFFLIVEASYILLTDWTRQLIRSEKIYERYSINIIKLSIPAFSVLGIIGEVLVLDPHSESNVSLGETLRQIASVGFLFIIVIYLFHVSYFAFVYGNGVATCKRLKVMILYMSDFLLLIEVVYRSLVNFSKFTDPINVSEWAFYVFEVLPELILLIILCGIILDEWFYKNDEGITQTTTHEVKRGCENDISGHSNAV